MKQETPKNPQAPAEALRRLLGSPEGKQLIALLNRDGGKSLQQAANEYRKGNAAGAQEVLKPLVETPEAAELLQKLSQR